ncbi:MAG: hypothetical protein ACRD3O_02070 [Terriglobia bacterium]
MSIDILHDWSITANELAEIVAENPSMRGLMFGFVAEYKVKKEWLLRPGIKNVMRPRSHDRKQKCDFTFDYKGVNVRLEVKCLDTPKVRSKDGIYEGTFQCNASDTTLVVLPNRRKVITNCLAVDGFDVLAVCLFAFGNNWRFAFARNRDLPRTTWHGYTASQQKYLLKSAMRISWPLQPPYIADLFTVLDGLVAERVRR